MSVPDRTESNISLDEGAIGHDLRRVLDRSTEEWIRLLTGARVSPVASPPQPPHLTAMADDRFHDDLSPPSMPGAWPEEDEAPAAEESLKTDESLRALRKTIEDHEVRPVDQALAAEVINRVRRYGKGRRGDDQKILSNDELMSKITAEDEKLWWKAQGLDDEVARALRSGAFYSGLVSPWGSFLTTGLNYVVAPLVGYAAGTPWATFGVGLGASILSPILNAAQQPAVSHLAEVVRTSIGPSVLLDKGIFHDKLWLQTLTGQVAAAALDFVGKGQTFTDTISVLLPAMDPAAEALTPADIVERLASAIPEDRERIRTSLQDFQGAEEKMEVLLLAMTTLWSMHKRRKVGNNWQILPRAARAPVATLVGLLRRFAGYSEIKTIGVQTAAALLIFGGNIFASARDSMNQNEYNNKMNLMYGDCLTDSGQAKLRSGQPLSAIDIDPDKLRGFVESPEQALIDHISGVVRSRITELAGRIEPLKEELEVQRLKAVEEGIPLPAGAVETEAEVEVMREMLAALEEEEKILESGMLDQLLPDSVVAALLQGKSDLVMQNIINRYKKKAEFSSQIAQRIGQTFHMIFFGSAGSSMVGKLSNAIVGGASHAAIPQTIGVAVIGAILCGLGAHFQSAAADIKNNRRSNAGGEQEIGWARQVFRGIFAAPIVGRDIFATNGARDEATEALKQMQEATRLASKVEEALVMLEQSAAI